MLSYSVELTSASHGYGPTDINCSRCPLQPACSASGSPFIPRRGGSTTANENGFPPIVNGRRIGRKRKFEIYKVTPSPEALRSLTRKGETTNVHMLPHGRTRRATSDTKCCTGNRREEPKDERTASLLGLLRKTSSRKQRKRSQ